LIPATSTYIKSNTQVKHPIKQHSNSFGTPVNHCMSGKSLDVLMDSNKDNRNITSPFGCGLKNTSYFSRPISFWEQESSDSPICLLPLILYWNISHNHSYSRPAWETPDPPKIVSHLRPTEKDQDRTPLVDILTVLSGLAAFKIPGFRFVFIKIMMFNIW